MRRAGGKATSATASNRSPSPRRVKVLVKLSETYGKEKQEMPTKKTAKKTTSSKLKVKVKDLKAKKDTKAAGLSNYTHCAQQIVVPRP